MKVIPLSYEVFKTSTNLTLNSTFNGVLFLLYACSFLVPHIHFAKKFSAKSSSVRSFSAKSFFAKFLVIKEEFKLMRAQKI